MGGTVWRGGGPGNEADKAAHLLLYDLEGMENTGEETMGWIQVKLVALKLPNFSDNQI